ncbi:MAG: glycosyltransferase [Planctomycetes bacterium]|nr:glycosyltransferase [Planctomycetota bacterium]
MTASATLAKPSCTADTDTAALRVPFITILMPVLNEAADLEATLASLLAQDYPADRFEIVVMDGRSTDATRALLDTIARRDPRVRWFDNPGVIVSTAINLGFGRARGEWIARADGHSTYAPDYLRAAMRAAAESGADVVGGPMVAGGDLSPFQRATEVALASRFGMGGAAFHFADRRGPSDGVYLGVFRADALTRYGPFHEELVRDEDDEWFARARRRGATIWLDGAIRSSYRPRPTPRALFRQYFEYGLFKPAALRLVPGSWRMRQLIPSALVCALLLPWVAGVPSLALAALLAYCGVLAAALVATRRMRDRGARATAQFVDVLARMHFGYGAGFLAGLFRRAHDNSAGAIRAVYREYAASGAKRRAWSATQPGQAQIVAERDRALAAALRRHFGPRKEPLRVLDLGAGDRDLATALATHGAPPCNVVACDLLDERLAANPQSQRVAADCRALPFTDRPFDVVVQCTMLSSVPAAAARRVIAAEMARVCKQDGLLLSYDARLGNPLNANVRRVTRTEHAALFADRTVAFERLTPLPPLVRCFPRLAALFARCAPLCAFDLAIASPRSRNAVAIGASS